MGKGKLYRMDIDGTIHVILEGIGCSNGMAFTQDQKGFYYTDSFAHEIYFFDYNARRRPYFPISESSQASMKQRDFRMERALDADGHLWSALWDGSSIVRLSSEGKIEKRISVPARKVSSLTFGGDDYSDIYITTAGGNTRDEDGLLAGATFRLKNEARGRPEFFLVHSGSLIEL